MSGTMGTLYELAEPQAGYFTTEQAVKAGVSRRALSGRTRRGDVERIRHGVYRLRDFPAHRFEDVAAVCLWAGQGSAASHETALAVHGVSDAMPANVHVTVPRPFRGEQPGVVVHHKSLPEQDREVKDGVPVTALARTLRDIASLSDPSVVQQAIAEAIERQLLSRRQLRTLVREVPALGPAAVDALSER